MSNANTPLPCFYGFGTPVQVVDCDDDDPTRPTGGCLTDAEVDQATPMTIDHATHVATHEAEYSSATVEVAVALLRDAERDDAYHEVGVALPPLDTRESLGVSAGFANDQRGVDPLGAADIGRSAGFAKETVVDEGEAQDAQNWHKAITD